MVEFGGQRQIAASQDVLAAQEHELEEKCPYPRNLLVELAF
jgi:hypothetical protein